MRPSPAANDSVDPSPDSGSHEAGIRHASKVIRWSIVGIGCAALILLYALSADAEELRGKVVHIADGDTVYVLVERQTYKIRLAGIDAPERKQAYGRVAHQSLSDMVAGRAVIVTTHKSDRYGRKVGVVVSDGHDVGLVQIERGLAWHYKQYAKEQSPKERRAYEDAEQTAKAAQRGLWRDPAPVAPWDWRQSHR